MEKQVAANVGWMNGNSFVSNKIGEQADLNIKGSEAYKRNANGRENHQSLRWTKESETELQTFDIHSFKCHSFYRPITLYKNIKSCKATISAYYIGNNPRPN